ncbi:MAG TPA: ATP-binding cassette domain-containing protein [Longimicrobiaceae bacterium]|nr:ATP-binding cassette domain-containing protein [Longimicrobiaceae bacterium]
MPTEPVLELNDATVVLGGQRVLDGVTLSIRAGEHAAIVGPNGSGKSSLVKLLTHQYRALHREGAPPVRVLGRDRWNVTELRSRMGIVSPDLQHRFVGGSSMGRLRGLDVVLSGFFASEVLFFHHEVTAEMRERAGEALERVGASHLGEKPLAAMSTGEARRVLIARALAPGPGVLVLDEPTTGLDLVARHAFMERVRGVAQAGTTVLLITHHVEEIVPEIDRVILLRRGRVALDGPKREVLTSASLSAAYSSPLTLEERAGWYSARLG